MEKIRAYGFPVALIAGWMVVAAYVLTEVSRRPAMPTYQAPEVIIEVAPPENPS
jgi:hypothetical protein